MGTITKIVIGIICSVAGLIIIGYMGSLFLQQDQATNNQVHQATNNQVHQDVIQLNGAYLKMVNDCIAFTSIADLTGCKSTLTDMKNKCSEDPQYSSMSVCNDPRINQFFSSVDSKIAYAESVISNDGSKLIDGCLHLISLGQSSQECISDMRQIQQECNTYNIDNHMAMCSDPRVNEILTGSIPSQNQTPTMPSLNQENQNNTNLIQSANQYTLSFIDSCMKATDPYVI